MADNYKVLGADGSTTYTLRAVDSAGILFPMGAAKGNDTVTFAARGNDTITFSARGNDTVTITGTPTITFAARGNDTILFAARGNDTVTLTGTPTVTFAARSSDTVTVGSATVLGTVCTGSASFARPADITAYTAGDAVGDSTAGVTWMTFSNFFRANGGSAILTNISLVTNKKSITPDFTVHLASDTYTISGDNLAWKSTYANESKRLGTVLLPAMTTPTDTTNSDQSRTENDTIRHQVKASGSSRALYAALVDNTAFTPASAQEFTLQIQGVAID